jgi:hypothetical protein
VNLQTSFQERYHHFHSHAQELIQHVLPYGDLQLQKKNPLMIMQQKEKNAENSGLIMLGKIKK